MSKSNKPIILYVLIALLVIAIAIGPIYSMFSDNEHTHAFDYNEVNELGQENMELLYRYHPTCAACRSIEDDVNDFADDNVHGIRLQKVHIDHEHNLPAGYERGVPTLLVVKDGEIVDEFVGANRIPEFFDDVNSGDYPVD